MHYSARIKAGIISLAIAFLASSGLSWAAPKEHRTLTPGQTWEAIVERVVDGDTLLVNVVSVTDNTTPPQSPSQEVKVKIRLAYIDAPETEKLKKGRIAKPGQPYGIEAERALAQMVKGRQVLIRPVAVDPYKRIVGHVFQGRQDVNLTMVHSGYAHVLPSFIKDRRIKKEFLAAQDIAAQSRRGLWQQPSPEKPKDFRQRTRTQGE